MLLGESSPVPGMASAHTQRVGVRTPSVSHTSKENLSLFEVDFHMLTN